MRNEEFKTSGCCIFVQINNRELEASVLPIISNVLLHTNISSSLLTSNSSLNHPEYSG